jgi:Na+/H+ antiporter NhaC
MIWLLLPVVLVASLVLYFLAFAFMGWITVRTPTNFEKRISLAYQWVEDRSNNETGLKRVFYKSLLWVIYLPVGILLMVLFGVYGAK